MSNLSKTVVIVEDDRETREYFVDVVGADEQLQVVEAVATVREGRAALARTVADVLLVDLGLPDGNGTELIRFAREIGAETQSLVSTVLADESNVVAAIQAGARGYLLKDGGAPDIRQAIHQVLAGGSPLSPGVARHVLRRFAELERAAVPAAHTARPEPALPRLSERETEILQYVVRGLTFPEIAELSHISIHTVTTYARRIYRKLEVSSRSEAVFHAVSLGIITMD